MKMSVPTHLGALSISTIGYQLLVLKCIISSLFYPLQDVSLSMHRFTAMVNFPMCFVYMILQPFSLLVVSVFNLWVSFCITLLVKFRSYFDMNNNISSYFLVNQSVNINA
jgi:site-specific recombinase